MQDAKTPIFGIVAIGRNEGARLETCLKSALRASPAVVYVDSGSTDDSVAAARRLGASVVELDRSAPFTAARGRNAGFTGLKTIAPGLRYVMFVDGDCEIAEGFCDEAAAFLDGHADVGLAYGRRRERFPNASVYNLLCDIEWQAPPGRTTEIGGDAMVRCDAFTQVGGYNATIISGEDTEFGFRLTHAGWALWRIAAEMTLHDVAMTRFRQWWRRNERGGHSFAELSALHGGRPERHRVRESRSVWIYGAIIPLLVLALAWPTRGLSAVLLLAYPLVFYRIRRHVIGRGWDSRQATVYALFTTIGKFPEAIGQIRYWLNRLLRRKTQIIEYKNSKAAPAAAGLPTARV